MYVKAGCSSPGEVEAREFPGLVSQSSPLVSSRFSDRHRQKNEERGMIEENIGWSPDAHTHRYLHTCEHTRSYYKFKIALKLISVSYRYNTSPSAFLQVIYVSSAEGHREVCHCASTWTHQAASVGQSQESSICQE